MTLLLFKKAPLLLVYYTLTKKTIVKNVESIYFTCHFERFVELIMKGNETIRISS